MRRQIRFKKTALSGAAAQVVQVCSGTASAQDAPVPAAAASAPASANTTGRRCALQMRCSF